MDFTVDESILNFITPAPPRLEAMEDLRDYRFTVPQLQALYSEYMRVEGFQNGDPDLKLNTFTSMLMNKINYSKNFGGFMNALPKNWQFINMQALQGMFRNIDIDNSGFVSWRQFFTYLMLSTSKLPTVNKLAEAKASCKASPTCTKD